LRKIPPRANRKLTIPFEETVIRRLRKDRKFAVEYLKAALGDEEEPRVLLIASRRREGLRKLRKPRELRERAYIGLYLSGGIRGCPRWLRSREPLD